MAEQKGKLSYFKNSKGLKSILRGGCRFNSQDEWNGNLDGRIERALDKKSIAVEDESTILFFPPLFFFPDNPPGRQWRGQDVPAGPVRHWKISTGKFRGYGRHRVHGTYRCSSIYLLFIDSPLAKHWTN